MPGHILSFDILGDYRSTCLANCNKPPRELPSTACSRRLRRCTRKCSKTCSYESFSMGALPSCLRG